MKKIVTAFKEHKEFKNEKPWDVNTMFFPTNEVVPPHYAETIEVLLCYDLKGTITIGAQNYTLCGNQAFFIAPRVIHSINYEQNDGKVYIVKLELENLRKYMDIYSIISKCGITFSSLSCSIDQSDAVINLSRKLSDSSASITDKLLSILYFLDAIIKESKNSNDYSLSPVDVKDLHCIISWTEENYKRHISIDEIADKFGYNKYYFCTKFKAATGTTYLTYVNTLRISYACSLLKNGYSVNETCIECGFENISYFIQLFKKMIGITPKNYATQDTC